MTRDLIRLVVRGLVAAVLVAAAVAAPVLSSSPTSPARAADLSAFQPGNIISDAVFFDSLSMDAAQVQSFLSAKGTSCVAGEMPCVKDYRQTTATQPGDAFCSTYAGAAQESAAAIIAKVGAACGINPRVLIVLLQKEQGLITGTRPTARKYEKATGFACPDTAACNPAFSGFVSQVYFAARQFQRYADGLAGGYRAGRTQNIQYHPDASCGTQSVYIANVATAGLYNYTPYVPNAAALAAGYGTGNSCSAYGNRNFYSYFTDWFGSTQSPGGEAILASYLSSGASSGPLGAAAGPVRCGLVANGCVQTYAGGNIYWSATTRAQIVLNGPLSTGWAMRAYEAGPLGYPTSAQSCGLAGGGCLQSFQNGTLYTQQVAGTYPVMRGTLADAWAVQRWESGPLGYPTGEPRCGLRADGCLQNFQGGTVYFSSTTGAQSVLNGPISGYWAGRQWESGSLGYPTGAQFCGLTPAGCLQNFQGGTVYSSTSSGTRSVMAGPIATAWAAQRWEAGPLRYPTGEQSCTTSTDCVQAFQGGLLTVSRATGAKVIPLGPIADSWTTRGGGSSTLGFPTRDQFCGLTAGGCLQNFQGGTLYTTTATGTRAVLNGPIADYWASRRWEAGPLGYPTGEATTTASGTVQEFQGGRVVMDPATGTVRFEARVAAAATSAAPVPPVTTMPSPSMTSPTSPAPGGASPTSPPSGSPTTSPAATPTA